MTGTHREGGLVQPDEASSAGEVRGNNLTVYRARALLGSASPSSVPTMRESRAASVSLYINDGIVHLPDLGIKVLSSGGGQLSKDQKDIRTVESENPAAERDFGGHVRRDAILTH